LGSPAGSTTAWRRATHACREHTLERDLARELRPFEPAIRRSLRLAVTTAAVTG